MVSENETAAPSASSASSTPIAEPASTDWLIVLFAADETVLREGLASPIWAVPGARPHVNIYDGSDDRIVGFISVDTEALVHQLLNAALAAKWDMHNSFPRGIDISPLVKGTEAEVAWVARLNEVDIASPVASSPNNSAQYDFDKGERALQTLKRELIDMSLKNLAEERDRAIHLENKEYELTQLMLKAATQDALDELEAEKERTLQRISEQAHDRMARLRNMTTEDVLAELNL